MTVSIWRYSHLLLALSSALFLILASLTGIVLALEPIQNSFNTHHDAVLSETSLAETISGLQKNYKEVLSLEVDADDFLVASVLTKNDDSETIYAHPTSGVKLGTPKPQAPIFQFATNLHRSLFLKSVGRFFVGLVSFLLCLIAITGLLLIIKRQGGLTKLFSKVQKDYFELRYHVILGRLFLIPIIIVAATGVYLSAEKFSLLPESGVRHEVSTDHPEGNLATKPHELDIFKNIKLSEVRSVNFPFSEMPEDYFEVSLQDREIYVHQYTGAILSEVQYPFTALASRWSLVLHTGQGSVFWSLVLLLASVSILFFIYSGFVMWRKRVKATKKSSKLEIDKDRASHIILVGSETGTTFQFAKYLADALNTSGASVFTAELNQYTTYQKAKHLIVLTATYGEGEATTNARKFEHLFKKVKPINEMTYSVIGFGSLLYPDYCAFAVKVDTVLQQEKQFKELLPLYKINNQDERAFQDWVKKWSKKTGLSLRLKIAPPKKTTAKTKTFTVVERTVLNEDDTFLLRLRPDRNTQFQSGDLAGITADDGMERLYSIARIENDVVLSVKKHEFGICSPLLSRLEPDSKMKLRIQRNTDFHFPKSNTPIVLIANGTGIAPFLGMLNENKNGIPVHVFFGLRTRKSLEIYENLLAEMSSAGKLASLQIAFSREEENKYVQDLIEEHPKIISETLEAGGSIFICGSLAMQNNVLDVLENISKTTLQKPLSEFEQQEQLKMDCY